MIKITSKPISDSHDRMLHSFCPFYLIKRYAEEHRPAAGTNEQFFIFSDRSPVKPNHMQNTLKNMLKIARFDPTVYSTHSFRIGRSCDLLQMGFSVETIKSLADGNLMLSTDTFVNSTYIFSDSVKAIEDIWFVGDSFLPEIFDEFNKMR